jgi:hypothetical protein
MLTVVSMVKPLFIYCPLLLLAALVARADSFSDLKHDLNTGTHQSLSRQFVIHDPAITNYDILYPEGATNFVRLDPRLLTVSCERIKSAVLKELGAPDQWRGRVYIELHPDGDQDGAVPVIPLLYDDNWIYQIQLPEVIERSRFISAVVEVTLLEIANRGASQITPIPAWLAQGMSRQVMLSSKVDLVLEPPKGRKNGVPFSLHQTDLAIEPAGKSESSKSRLLKLRNYYHREDSLAEAHDELRVTTPLSLDQLSWPAPNQFEGQSAESYRSSAQFFVHELLQLPDGRAGMRALLPELARHLNWQIAFLKAFHSDFSSQLALDKWWTLRVVQFTGHDLSHAWPSAESWQKLDELVRPPVQVRTEADEMPLSSQVNLQTIVREWPLDQQLPVLREKAQQLGLIRSLVSLDLTALVDGYRQVLEDYIEQSSNSHPAPMGRTINAPRQILITRETLRKLDELEARRQQFRPQPDGQPVTASAPVNP